MTESVEGIILYVTPFKESSEILQVLTKEYGLIGLLCRGSKKVKSKFLNKTRIYNYAKFFINYKKEGLSIVKEIDVIDYFNYFHQDINLITYLSYLGSLTYQVVKQDNNKDILNIFKGKISKKNIIYTVLSLIIIIGLIFLRVLGITLLILSIIISSYIINRNKKDNKIKYLSIMYILIMFICTLNLVRANNIIYLILSIADIISLYSLSLKKLK